MRSRAGKRLGRRRIEIVPNNKHAPSVQLHTLVSLAKNAPQPTSRPPTTDTQSTMAAAAANDINLRKGYFFMCLLALQFGLQPLLAKAFITGGVDKVVFVLGLEATKCAIGFGILVSSGTLGAEAKKWTLSSSLKMAGAPAMIYAVQNVLIQIAYQNLTGLVFNLVNQTKTLFAAFFVWVFIGKAQSPQQCFALVLLLIATLVLTLGSSQEEQQQNDLVYGLAPIIAASALSGLASALCQRAMQGQTGRSPTVFSVELAVYSAITLLAGLATSGQGAVLLARPGGPFAGWTVWTLAPLFTQAFGGMVIGQVTKHAGSVRKGFAVCFGIVVTAVAQYLVHGEALLAKHWIGLALVTLSTWIHSRYPMGKVAQPPQGKGKAKKA